MNTGTKRKDSKASPLNALGCEGEIFRPLEGSGREDQRIRSRRAETYSHRLMRGPWSACRTVPAEGQNVLPAVHGPCCSAQHYSSKQCPGELEGLHHCKASRSHSGCNPALAGQCRTYHPAARGNHQSSPIALTMSFSSAKAFLAKALYSWALRYSRRMP